MDQNTIAETVGRFIRINFLFDENAELSNQKSLLGSGVIDSTGVLELIAFLEQQFKVKFEDSELVVENFDTVEKIGQFVIRKTKSEATA